VSFKSLEVKFEAANHTSGCPILKATYIYISTMERRKGRQPVGKAGGAGKGAAATVDASHEDYVPPLFFPTGMMHIDDDPKTQQEERILSEWQDQYIERHINAGHTGICFAWLDNAFCPLKFSTGR